MKLYNISLEEAEDAIFDDDILEELFGLSAESFLQEISGSQLDSQMMVTIGCIYIQDLDLYIRIGHWGEDYTPVTVIYPTMKVDEYLTFEQDGFVTTIFNHLNGQKSVDAVKDLSCKLIMEAA